MLPERLITLTYNLGNALDGAVLRDLERRLTGVHIAGLQEAGDRWDVLHDFQTLHPGEWGIWAGDAPGAKSVPMLYRLDLGPVRLGSRLAVSPMYVGRGAGPSWSKAKAINVVGVGNLDVLNTHFIASASGPDGKALRKAHYRIHARVLARMLQNRINKGRDVLAVGDFNSPPSDPLLDPLRAVMFPPTPALTQLVNVPTHGAKIYDQGWSDQMGTVVVGSGSSDHHPVTIELPLRTS